ncbi:NAD-dependent protein deacetylase sirtuin-2 [Chytriomyces hyalinus]|nr:NAD-dependent protein deacetylase sirtuin-2 [Chytriomyces hyalinus]
MGPKRKAPAANEKARKKTLSEIPEPESIPKTPTTNTANMTPKLNHPAPQFETAAVVNKQFKDVKLSDYKGQWVVLFFYPLDFTFVCPTEIIAFSEASEEFKKINTQVIGCSVDSKFSHLAWINQSRDNGGLGEMKIPLLADVKKEIATAYGVLKEDEGIAYRGTFIIDPKQNLRQITINDLDVGRNVEEVKRLVDAFQFHDEHGDVCPVNWKKGGKTMKADVDGSKEYFQAAYKKFGFCDCFGAVGDEDQLAGALLNLISLGTHPEGSHRMNEISGYLQRGGRMLFGHGAAAAKILTQIPSLMSQNNTNTPQPPPPTKGGGAFSFSFNPFASRVAAVTPREKKLLNPELNILADNSVGAFVDLLKKNNLRRILVMTGAGISTSAGIPDFRSPSTGLYANLAKYELPYPEAVFSINYFRKSPKPFFTLAKELYPGCFRPTVCHYFIRLLAEEGMLLRCYTQNIDTLERVAGIDEKYLVEAHGSFASAKCVGKYRKPEPVVSDVPSLQDETTTSDSDSDIFLDETDFKACGKEYTQEWVKTHVFDDKIPECDRCQGIVKPNITFFGESLPKRFHAMTYSDFSQADALIVIGTSLQVQPFAGLINRVGAKVPRLLLNMELVGVDDESKTHGFDFEGDRHEYRRDALFLGAADSGCERLAELMGLGDKLKDLIAREYAKLDCEEAEAKQTSVPVRQEIEEESDTAVANLVAADEVATNAVAEEVVAAAVGVAVDEVGEILSELKL